MSVQVALQMLDVAAEMQRTSKGCHDASEVFELSIEQPMTGMELARSGGDSYWEQWRFCGSEMSKPETKRFKLIYFSHGVEVEDVVREAPNSYKHPHGQWLLAYKKAFPDRCKFIGVARPEWQDECRRARHPNLNCFGRFSFGHATSISHTYRWLVEVTD